MVHCKFFSDARDEAYDVLYVIYYIHYIYNSSLIMESRKSLIYPKTVHKIFN